MSDAPLRSLTTLTTPTDFQRLGQLGELFGGGLGMVWIEGQLTELKLRQSTAWMVLRDPAAER